MKYFTFQSQFHDPIIDLVKRSTIRPKKKLQTGERFALRYWTAKPYRGPMGILGTAKCISVFKFDMDPNNIWIDGKFFHEESRLAMQEGFRSIDHMRDWFTATHGPSFSGFIHSWSDFEIDESAASARRTAYMANTKLTRPASESVPATGADGLGASDLLWADHQPERKP